jgi:copper chaperone CopZ
MQVQLKIEGMHCAGCARAVETVLSKVAAVEAVDVRLDAGEALVTANGEIDTAALVAAVDEAGYEATVASASR